MTGSVDTEKPSATYGPGREQVIRLRLEELLGPVEERSASLVAALIMSFLSRAGDYLVMLADAIERMDADTIARSGHSLKGMAGNLGATELAAISDAMEACGRSGQLSSAPRLLARLTAELDVLRPAMHQVLAA